MNKRELIEQGVFIFSFRYVPFPYAVEDVYLIGGKICEDAEIKFYLDHLPIENFDIDVYEHTPIRSVWKLID
jgi:hypothetical protein